METKLVKYAHYIGKRVGQQDEWKIVESGVADLQITLSDNHHLIVWQDSKIMENVSLWNSDSWMKAIAKGDSMLFVSKHQGAHRRFRVKFANKPSQTGSEVRRIWSERLRRYFTVNEVATEKEGSQGAEREADVKHDTLQGEASIGSIIKALCGEEKATLPAVYQQTTLPTQSTTLQNLVSLCLTDTNFPAFVDQVDRQLDRLMQKPGDSGTDC